MNRRMKYLMMAVGLSATGLVACGGGGGGGGTGTRTETPAVNAPGDIHVQAAYDEENIALRFTWKSHAKAFPAGFANVGQTYPGQFHDLMKHDGTKFAQIVVEDERFNEDRVSFMIEDPLRPVQGFGAAGCYVACHTNPDGTLMANHKLANAGFLDFWHWRGGRSGPAGYAEDTYTDAVQRQRDAAGTPPSKWLRSAGDRLREDQGALAGTGHDKAEGMPRFLFNKGKQMPGGFVLPTYFLSDEAGSVIVNPYAKVPQVKDVAKNRSLLVVFQDRAFDTVDKVNSVDVGYLAYVAKGTTAHLPAHLRDTTLPAFAAWASFWSQELGIAANPADAAAVTAAETRLTAINQEWETSNRLALISRSVAFIYPSDQHDITTTRSFDPANGIWTVTMYRKLSSLQVNDTDLAALRNGTVYNLGFAIHDVGDAHESHHISLPSTLGNAASTADIKAQAVTDVKSAEWQKNPGFLTRVFQPGTKTGTHLADAQKHPGAGSFGVSRCQGCHNVSQMPGLVAR